MKAFKTALILLAVLGLFGAGNLTIVSAAMLSIVAASVLQAVRARRG